MKPNSKSLLDEVQNAITLLREKRHFLNLTQHNVAERAGIPYSAYIKFESGERNIWTSSFTTVCKILYALEMNPDDFFCGRYVIRKVKIECPVIVERKA